MNGSDFNLQAYLTEQERDRKADHAQLVAKLDEVRVRLSQFETRVTLVEYDVKRAGALAKWIAVTIVGAFVSWVVSFFKHP